MDLGCANGVLDAKHVPVRPIKKKTSPHKQTLPKHVIQRHASAASVPEPPPYDTDKLLEGLVFFTDPLCRRRQQAQSLCKCENQGDSLRQGGPMQRAGLTRHGCRAGAGKESQQGCRSGVATHRQHWPYQ